MPSIPTQTSWISSGTGIQTYAELKAAIHWLRNSEQAGGNARLGGHVADLLESVAENGDIPASVIPDFVASVHQDMCDTSVTFADALKRHDYPTALDIASKFVNFLRKRADAEETARCQETERYEETKYAGEYDNTVVSQPSTGLDRQIFHQGELDNPYCIDGEPCIQNSKDNTKWGLWTNGSGAWMAHPETLECWKVTDQGEPLPTFLADKEPDRAKTHLFKEAARRRARSLNQDVPSRVDQESQQALNPSDRQSSRSSPGDQVPPASPVSTRPPSTTPPKKVRFVQPRQATQNSTATRSRADGESKMSEMPRAVYQEGYGSRSGRPSTRSTAQPLAFGAASSMGPNEAYINFRNFWDDPSLTHGVWTPTSQWVNC